MSPLPLLAHRSFNAGGRESAGIYYSAVLSVLSKKWVAGAHEIMFAVVSLCKRACPVLRYGGE